MLQDRGAVLTGFGLDIGLMYFLDPERGRRRRTRVRDQVAQGTRITGDAAGACRIARLAQSHASAARLGEIHQDRCVPRVDGIGLQFLIGMAARNPSGDQKRSERRDA